MASKLAGQPHAVWFWHLLDGRMQGVVLFRAEIKQMLWHPTSPGTLVVITQCRDPVVYVCLSGSPPEAVSIPSLQGVRSARWEATWIKCQQTQSQLFMLSSAKAFDVGIFEIETEGEADRLVFRSTLDG